MRPGLPLVRTGNMVYIGPNDETTKGHTMDYREHMENAHGWGFPEDYPESEIEALHHQDHQRDDDKRESFTIGDHLGDHGELDYGTREVLFQPYMHVKVLADGRREIKWDWSDTMLGETGAGDPDNSSPLATEISAWVDDLRRSGALPDTDPPADLPVPTDPS
jgi:hypothetical protein